MSDTHWIAGELWLGAWVPGAVCIENGRIVQIHRREDGPNPPNSVPVERVTPGWVDAHAHPRGVGSALTRLSLRGCASLAEALARVAAAPGEGWLRGEGWDQNTWEERRWPSADDLEAVAPGRKIALRRVDGHASWVSRAALAAAGIGPHTPDLLGGALLRDDRGAPTGVLLDAAMRLVSPPQADPMAQRQDYLRGLRAFADQGYTGVHVMGASAAEWALLRDLEEAGQMPVRLWVYRDDGDWMGVDASGDRVRFAGVKLYADGALGSRGAWLSAPYADDRSGGLSTLTDSTLQRWLHRAAADNFGVAVHAIGDAAVRLVLDGARAVPAARLRVEHAQVVHPDDLPRFSEVEVSFQPTHAWADAPWVEARLGAARRSWAYPWAALAAHGRYALGSDAPIEGPESWEGMRAATSHPWGPALTEAQAIHGFTAGAAQIAGWEGGSLAVGAPADLSLWGSGAHGAWTPVGTVVAGKLRWIEAQG